MKAIILAGGIGSRISREVNQPKSLLDIGDGMPLLRYTVTMLQKKGIDVSIVLGFKQEMFREILKDLDVTFYVNPFYRVTNSLASLWFAKEALTEEEDYIFMNADVYLEPEILDKMLCSDQMISMLADYRKILEGDYFFHCDEKGLVRKYGKEMPVEERTCEYVGAAKIGREYVAEFKRVMEEMVAAEQYTTWWETILYSRCDEIDIHTIDAAPYFWSEIDYIEDYEKIVNFVKEKHRHGF
ncbi:MAG: NTP transferase domain-containing protein [Lachnospiraceae bacterium]